MAKKQKYYVVWKGVKRGVFETWEECKAQITGFPQAQYKSFPTRQEAESAFINPTSFHQKKATAKRQTNSQPIWQSISVDAACSGNPGLMEYQGVETQSKRILFRQGVFKDGTNNIGEFLAIVHGLAYLKRLDTVLPIYTDSRTAMAWVRNKKVKTTLSQTSANQKLFELIERGEHWLKNNTYDTIPIIKWETKIWGEIPADFGRK